MSDQTFVTLNDGRRMPQLGLGAWAIASEEAAAVVHTAVDAGYRLVDTAAIYGNERGVGEGVRTCSAGREAVFLTTKLWNDRQGYDAALGAFERSLDRLGLDCVDLYLIHWPAPSRGLYVETWRAFMELAAQGRARSIGVSNFTIEDLRRLIGETGVTPAVNQIELHPRFQQKALRDFHAEHGIVTESWSPLGQGKLLDDPVLGDIARKHGKTPAQAVIRWHLELGLVVIPKSASPVRIAQNLDVFDFSLDAEDMERIAALDDAGGRIGLDPLTFA